jgi:hypothetical protein
MACPDVPARDSLRIAANSSNFDIRALADLRPDQPMLPPPPVALKLADIESIRSRRPADGARAQ